MTPEQADAWIGRSIRLGGEVVTEGVRCARPSYTAITLVAFWVALVLTRRRLLATGAVLAGLIFLRI